MSWVFLALLKRVRGGEGVWQIGVAQGIDNGLWSYIPLGHHFKSGALLIKDIAYSVICILKIYKLLWASWLMTWIKLIVKRNVCPKRTLLKTAEVIFQCNSNSVVRYRREILLLLIFELNWWGNYLFISKGN